MTGTKNIEHSKYYYEYDRNLKITDTARHLLVRDKSVPEYYIGRNGYEARKVVDNFDLSYHIGTAVTYLLRAERKHDNPISDIKKAIAHLAFEVERLNNDDAPDWKDEIIRNNSIVGGKLWRSRYSEF